MDLDVLRAEWSKVLNQVECSFSSLLKEEPSQLSAQAVQSHRTKAPEVLLLKNTRKKAVSEQDKAAEEVMQFWEVLNEESEALDRSLQQIVDVMLSTDSNNVKNLVSQWASSYKRSSKQLELAYASVQKSQRLLNSTLAIASDPTLQFTKAGVSPLQEIGALTISSFADFDFSTGQDFFYEHNDVTEGIQAPSPSSFQATLGDITGRYRRLLKLFGGVSAIGASATLYARSQIILRAEDSLNLMKQDLRKIEGGDVGQLLIWISEVESLSQYDVSLFKKLLEKQGVAISDLERELGHPVNVGDLQTPEGRTALVKLFCQSLKREMISLETFVTLAKEKLKEDALNISVSTTKFGSQVVGFILSIASVSSQVPSLISSSLVLAGSSIKLHESRKSLQRLGHYGAQINRGAVSFDAKQTEKEREKGFWSGIAIKKYKQMIALVVPKSAKEQKNSAIDSSTEEQLRKYGINIQEINRTLEKNPIATLHDLMREDVKPLIIQQMINHEIHLFRERMAEKKYEEIALSLFPFPEDRQKDVRIGSILKDQLKNQGVDIDKLNENLGDKPIEKIGDILRPEIRRLIINDLTSKEKIVTEIQAHLGRMEQANLDNRKKIRDTIVRMTRDLMDGNPNMPSKELVALFEKELEKKFGLSMDLKEQYSKELDVQGKKTIEFKQFIRGQLEGIIDKTAAHHETMNVSTRNFFRTLADQKVKAEKTISKWSVGLSSLYVATSVASLLACVLSIITIAGLVSLGIAATWVSIGATFGLVLGFAIGMAVLYYYKPHVFKSIFSLKAIKANYANLRMARRTFEAVNAVHQKNLAAVNALNEKVNVQLSGIEMLRRLYEVDNKAQKEWAGAKLRALGLIDTSGDFDRTEWDRRKLQLEEAQYEKIKMILGSLLLGHHLELGSFGIGKRKVNVGEWTEATIEGVISKAEEKKWSIEQVKEECISVVKKDFGPFKFMEKDENILRELLSNVRKNSDLDSPSFKSKFLIFYTSIVLEKEIERQKEKSGKFYDSYNSLQKYSQEYNKRLQACAFDDTFNRLAFGSAHAKIEQIAHDKFLSTKKQLENLIVFQGEDKVIDEGVKKHLRRIGINCVWLERDLKLEKLDGVQTLGDLKKLEVLRLIESQFRDRVHMHLKGNEALRVAEEVIKEFAKARGITSPNKMRELNLFVKSRPRTGNRTKGAENLIVKLSARGIDIYGVIKALDPDVKVECVKDLNHPKVKAEIIRRYREDWYQLFKKAPERISKSFQEGSLDPLTAEFLSKEMGIDLEHYVRGGALPEVQKFVAMGGGDLNAFLKKREYLASIESRSV